MRKATCHVRKFKKEVHMNKQVTRILGFTKKVLFLSSLMRLLNKIIRFVSRISHKTQFLIDWSVNAPENFDHQIDLNWQWHTKRSSFPFERGVFSNLAISNGSDILDLCCGDGFNSYYFYSQRAKSVTAIDFDQFAIKWARRNYKTTNLKFEVCDIRTSIPDGPFHNVVWDAAVEHFTENEITNIMSRIKQVLTPKGVLSGHTITEAPDGGKHLHQHEYEFHDKADLARFLSPHFKNIHVFETVFPERTNLYFYATDGELPTDTDAHLFIRV